MTCFSTVRVGGLTRMGRDGTLMYRAVNGCFGRTTNTFLFTIPDYVMLCIYMMVLNCLFRESGQSNDFRQIIFCVPVFQRCFSIAVILLHCLKHSHNGAYFNHLSSVSLYAIQNLIQRDNFFFFTSMPTMSSEDTVIHFHQPSLHTFMGSLAPHLSSSQLCSLRTFLWSSISKC